MKTLLFSKHHVGGTRNLLYLEPCNRGRDAILLFGHKRNFAKKKKKNSLRCMQAAVPTARVISDWEPFNIFNCFDQRGNILELRKLEICDGNNL